MYHLTEEQKLENLKEVYAAKQQKYFKLRDELNNLTKKILKKDQSFQVSHLSQEDFEELKLEWENWNQEKRNS